MSFLKTVSDFFNRIFKKFGENSFHGKLTIAILAFVLIFFILSFDLFVARVNLLNLKAGDICPHDIVSQEFITFADEEETKRNKNNSRISF